MMRKEIDYHLEDPTWCRGCGIYGVFAAFKKAAVSLNLDPEQLVIVSGIGCHGRFNNYFKAYGIHTLHGRTLPMVTGVKLANPRLHVVGISGDGDAYSIGLGHFLHAVRRNIGITYVVVNNQVYALTQGQTSPTSKKGYVSISTPFGSSEEPLDGPRLAFFADATFVARGFIGEPAHLTDLIKKGIKHRGFALVEVLSPCVTHNKMNTYQWYRDNIERLDEDSSYDPRNRAQAREALDKEGKIPIGLIYKESKPPFESLVYRDERKPLVFEDLRIDSSKIEKILDEFD